MSNKSNAQTNLKNSSGKVITSYRKTDEYLASSRRVRRNTFRMIFSIIAIFVPFAYFAASVMAEKYFYPKWSFGIGFYIFILGLAGAAVIIPLLFKIFTCPFTYWKLFLGIAVSLALGYICSYAVFRIWKLDDDPILMSQIIFGIQALVCTVFAVIGANRNMWECISSRSKRKEVKNVYKKFETAVNSDPVDVITVFAMAESDYSFAVDYMKDKDVLLKLHETAHQNVILGKISEEEFEKISYAVAAGGIGDVAVACAKSYIDSDESKLIKMSVDEKKDAVAILDTLGKQAETDEEAKRLWTVLRARLLSSMIIYDTNEEKNIANLLESSEELKKLIENSTRNDELAKSAKQALEYTENTLHHSLVNKNNK